MFWAHVMCFCLFREFRSQSSSLESRFFRSKWCLEGCEETGLGFWDPCLLLKPTLYAYNSYQRCCFSRGSATITYTLYVLYTEAKKKKKHICHHPTAIHFDSTFSSPGEKDSQEWLRKSRDENSVADTYIPQKCVIWPFGSFFFPLRSLQVIWLCPWQTTLAPEICVYQTSSSFILSFLFLCDCSLGMAFYCSKCGSSDAVHLIPEGTESIALDSGSHLLHSILPAPYSTLLT